VSSWVCKWQPTNPSNWGECSEDQDGFMKRQRGRGRKPGGGGGGGSHGNHGNRALESNGPEVKIRGTAAQIYEKYSQYARDAQSGGDRVKYENYLQHAEHYFRVMVATMPRDRILPQQDGGGMPVQQQGGEGGQQVAGPVDASAPVDPMKVVDDQGGDDDGDYEGNDEGNDDRDEVEAAGGGGQNETQNASQDGDRQGRRRRRGRRNRPQDDRGGAGGGGGDNTGGGGGNSGSALDSLARKQGALAGG
jgi:hypothetical protein